MARNASEHWPLGRRLAAEFVVIVVGVLVALAVDAAREVRESSCGPTRTWNSSGRT